MRYLYRLRSGEILGQSIDPAVWSGVDAQFFAVLESPAEDPALDRTQPMIWDGTTVRNATASEVAAFPTAAQSDDNLAAREEVAALFLGEKSSLGKMFRLITLVAMDEINVLRQQMGLTPLTIDDIRAKARAYLDAGAVD